MKAFIFTVLGYVLLISTSHSQSILEEYIAYGLEHNQKMLQEKLEQDQTQAALKEAKGYFLPEVSFQASYTQAQGGRNISFPVGDIVNPVYQALDLPTRLDNVEEQLLPDNFHETKLRLIQPLFNSDIYYQYKARQAFTKVQEARVESYKQELVKHIKQGYFNYLKTVEVVNIYQETEALLKELLRINKKLVANQKATPDVVYRAESELSSLYSDLAEAEKNYAQSKAYFNFLLDRPLDTEVRADSTLVFSILQPDSPVELQTRALQKRPDLLQLQNGIAAQDELISLQKGQKLPQLSLVADAGYQGFGYKFDSNQDFWLVGLSLQWTLFKGSVYKSQTQQARIERQQLTSQFSELQNQIRLQVIQAWHDLAASGKQVQAKKAGSKSADRNFKLMRRKYEEGMALLVERLDAQTQYTTAQIQLAISKYDHWISKAELDYTISQL